MPMCFGGSGRSWIRGRRQLLENKYVLNMSDAEIASALGVKPSSVRMLLTRARSKARKAIEKKM